MDDENVPEPSFYLFINSGSGGSLGSRLLSQEIEKIEFLIPMKEAPIHKCSLYFYNMRQNRDHGFRRLKKQVQAKVKCYVIVCGGDGTVMWVVSELVKHDIPVLEVPIGIIPLGTGNDFSRDLGWGGQSGQLLQNNYKPLKKLIRSWLNAREQYFDLWDVEATIYQGGKFEKVENGQNALIEGNTIRKTFCNYFSFGIDGKIGYSFDMHRTTSRMGNLAMYGLLGTIKAVTKTKTLDQLLDSIEIFAAEPKALDQSMNENSRSNMSNQDKQKTSYVIRNLMDPSEQGKQENQSFNKGFYNILALNIDSYTGGVKNIWRNAKNGFIKNKLPRGQRLVSTGDGKIQIVCFASSVGIAMERSLGGFASKVAQAEGPFIFNFRRYPNLPKHRTYLQIDGEFIRFTAPERITLSRSSLVPRGKIKVLRNRSCVPSPFE